MLKRVIKKNSKGLSTIVATLLIILLTLVAVGIIWVVVRNVIQGGSEQISLGKFTLDLKINQVQRINDSALNIILKRNSGKGDFVGIAFIAEDNVGTEVVKKNVSMKELETKSFQLHFTTLNVSNLKKISIAPVFRLESGKEVNGDVEDEYIIGGSSGVLTCTSYCPTGAMCGSDGCGGSCGSGCTQQGYVCSNYQCVQQLTCTDTCLSLNYNCGTQTICGNNINCGNCLFGQTCVGGVCTGSIPAPIFLRTFYVNATTGNDANDGRTPANAWKTIAKVNSATFLPGDGILFERGDTWYGTLTISQSGNSTHYITYSAYGLGNQPIITGFTTITGWTNEGNGIYSKIITSATQTNMVTIDGVPYGMGRWPDSSYNILESFVLNISITDNELTNAINWTGAEVVIRKNDWSLDRCLVTNHVGSLLNYINLYGSNQNARANYGYFIQNDLRAVTNYGEWYHNTSNNKFYMYFGTIDPNTKIVNVATLNNSIYNPRYDYIKIEDLALIGSIDSSVSFSWDSNYCIMQNCNVSFAGGDGIRFSGFYGRIDNNYVQDCVRTGIGTFYTGTNTIITNNTVLNIGLIQGLGKPIRGVWSPIGNGIAVEYDNNLVQYNRIENIGYSGIIVSGYSDFVEIKNNFINNICLVLDDCGGIYTEGSHSYMLFEGNIILNSVGNTDGAADATPMAEGIYLDESASNITVQNNTVANCASSGIKLHKGRNDIVKNNILFNNNAAINFENWVGSGQIYGNVLTENIFFAKTAEQSALRFRSVSNDIPSFGTASNNYYARPIDDSGVFNLYQPSIGEVIRTLAEWQAFTSQDINSHKSPKSIITVNDIFFDYNPTRVNKVITLSGNYIDVTGASYSGSIILKPYTSIVLIKN